MSKAEYFLDFYINSLHEAPIQNAPSNLCYKLSVT